MPVQTARIEARLGYHFQDPDLLKQALTHRSMGVHNNERLEFLGDSILNFVIAEALYKQFPDANEGQMSRLRARQVRGTTLAEISRELSLGEHLLLGQGELRSGGFNRDSILSDALEAIIGAIYLEAGLQTISKQILSWFESRLSQVSLASSGKDAKTLLQEYTQAEHGQVPKYLLVSATGKAPDQVFNVECQTTLLDKPTSGKGSSRRLAEQIAASAALKKLGVNES